jgi:GAF domain-containing protein
MHPFSATLPAPHPFGLPLPVAKGAIAFRAPTNPAEEPFFYTALTVSALQETASAAQQQSGRELLTAHEERLREWAEGYPPTFADKHSLLSAEIARHEGRDADAIRLYEQAIQQARDHGFVQNEGLAHELAARYYLSRGIETAAYAYVRNARNCYDRWGAHGKVGQLEERYPRLREERAGPSTATVGPPWRQLEVETVVKASQALSTEMVLPRLIERLMRIALEHAAAERGMLILMRSGEPRLEAEATTRQGSVDVVVRHALVTPSDLPTSVLHYVVRTREHVLLDDAAADRIYSTDEHVQKRRSRSVLCLPIVKQTSLVGAMYLENNLTPGAFTPDRVAVLQLLASQAAISLENAALYTDLQVQVGVLQHLPVSAWTLKPDGTSDFVNEVWLQFAGQTLDFVRSHPEAWMTAVHPEDREVTAKSFWDGVSAGRGFAIEYRTMRAQDGVYRSVLSQAVVLRDAEGKVLKFVGYHPRPDATKFPAPRSVGRGSSGSKWPVTESRPCLDRVNTILGGRARVGPSILDVLEPLDQELHRASYTLRRPDLPASEDILLLYLRAKLVGVSWIGEIESYRKGCSELAAKRSEHLCFNAVRNAQTLVKLVYPSSSTDEKDPIASASSAAAEGVLANRFVAFLLAEADKHFRRAILPASDIERFRACQALVRALDLLVRAVRSFAALYVQSLEAALGRPERIQARVNHTVHSRDFFEISRQTFFRELPANVFYDYEPHSAIISFRTALERKLREAIAVQSFQLDRSRISWHKHAITWARKTLGDPRRLFRRQRGDAPPPVPEVRIISMSAILGAWNELGLRILAPNISVGQLQRLYRWANQVVHGGRRTTPQEIWFALDLTTGLLRGTRIGSGSTNKTIVTDVSVEAQVAALRKQMKLGREWRAIVLM